MDVLRAHWAISEPVRDFLAYILSHPHEVQSLLQINWRTDDAVARGPIDARRTVLTRQVLAHPTLVVSEEPVRSFNSGPNQLVAWVVHTAALHVARLFAVQPPGSAYSGLVEAAMSAIALVKRLDVLREPVKHLDVSRKPGPHSLRNAARSRRMVYRHAIVAYDTLTRLEAGDEEALLSVLRSTLMAPLEQWRRFELAVAVGIGEALAQETEEAMHVSTLGTQYGQPIIRCGRYALYWQSVTSFFSSPPLEPSEARLEAALEAYGMSLGSDRPDIVVVDEKAGTVAAIVEVKYLAGDTAAVRFREAVAQVVRYARGYTNPASVGNLVNRSLIALSINAPSTVSSATPTVWSVDFPAIRQGALRVWVRDRLLGACS